MTGYNRVNGLHASENTFLLDEVLRKEWQWKGMIMSDWFGTYSATESTRAGLDLEMPVGTFVVCVYESSAHYVVDSGPCSSSWRGPPPCVERP